MKFATVSKTLVLGLALLVASSAFAGTKASLTLYDPVTVNGTTLKPGDYKLEWEGTGPSVEVNVKQGKNVVVKVPAKLVDLSSPSASTATVVQKNSDGTASLVGARFEGKKFALEMGESGAGMQTGSGK